MDPAKRDRNAAIVQGSLGNYIARRIGHAILGSGLVLLLLPLVFIDRGILVGPPADDFLLIPRPLPPLSPDEARANGYDERTGRVTARDPGPGAEGYLEAVRGHCTAELTPFRKGPPQPVGTRRLVQPSPAQNKRACPNRGSQGCTS
jgi:hypothetical protein